MKKNLVPEQRLDKNGKRVLRWVKDEFVDNRGMKLPPAQIAHRQAQIDAREILFPGRAYLTGDATKDSVVAYLEKIPGMLPRILEAVQSDEDLADNLRTLMGDPFRLTGTPVEESKVVFERALAVQPYTKRAIQLLGLEEDPETTRDEMFRMEKVILDMRYVDLNDQDLVRAAILVGIFEGFPYEAKASARELWVKSEDDIRYIAENIDAVEALAPELQRRETYDAKVIEEMLSSESKSLSSGAL